MKAVRFQISRENRGVTPIDVALTVATRIHLVDLLYLDAFETTQGVFCYRMHGPPEAIRRTVDDEPTVSVYSLAVDEGNVHHLYLRGSFDDPGGFLMRLSATYPVLLDTPITYTDEGDARVVVAATESVLQEVCQDAATDEDVRITRIETYSAEGSRVLESLTDLQRDVLHRGLERGYYSVPRNATQGDLATDFGVASSTMEEHLRQIELKVFHGLLS